MTGRRDRITTVGAGCRHVVASPLSIAWVVLTSALAPSALAGDGGPSAAMLAIRAGKVVTMDPQDTVVNNAIVFVNAGRIERVAPSAGTKIPGDYRVIDARDRWVFPGLVDAHNHTAGSLMDLNDMVYLTNPGLRTLETILPENKLVKDARAGGVTTVLLIPGSGTNMSGFGTIAKTAGASVDDVVVRSPGSLKIAQAGNPEWYWYGVGRSFMNYNTRQTLEKARDYHLAWEAYEKGETADPPLFDPIFDDFRGLFRGEFPASVHTQIYQVLMTTVDMLASKMKIKTVLDHCTFDAFKVAPQVLKTGAFTINGPRQFWFDRSQRKIHGNAARWWQGGVHKLGINTDAPVIPEKELSFQAAMACRYGWLPYPALAGITRVPAASLMVDDVGSIEPGKSADLGIWSGDPLDPRSSCEMTFIRGRLVYDAAVKRRF